MINKTRLFLFALFILTACSKDDSNQNEATVPIGSITDQEFEASLPPTYDNFNSAYLTIVGNTLLAPGTDDFSRALFEEIKLNYPSNGRANGADNEIFFSGKSYMNKQEWRLVLNDPEQAYKSISLIARSLDDALTYFPCDEDVFYSGAKATAFKQAFWSALMAKNTSVEFAQKMGDAREAITANMALKNMNLHNNAFGIKLSTRFPTASNNQLFELLVQENYFLKADNTDIDSDLDGLVFLNGIRDFDKTMTGSFGNPDSGGPWDITVNFS